MGDLCDQADLDRFLRSPEGQQELADISRRLINERITHVHFTNQVHYIGIGIAFEDGSVFACQLPEYEVDMLRNRFGEVLDREYDKDYPKRKEV